MVSTFRVLERRGREGREGIEGREGVEGREEGAKG